MLSRNRQPSHRRPVSGHWTESHVATARRPRNVRPAAAFRQRGIWHRASPDFSPPEDWHEPLEQSGTRLIEQQPGEGLVHPVTRDEIKERLADLPEDIVAQVEVVQLSRMTRKKALFPRYGMQWGQNVYLYPLEESLVERYVRPPRTEQQIEARMFGGVWSEVGSEWHLIWTPETIRDFYLNNVLIHEIGHVVDQRNTNPRKREQFANWFATEYGFRASRGRR